MKHSAIHLCIYRKEKVRAKMHANSPDANFSHGNVVERRSLPRSVKTSGMAPKASSLVLIRRPGRCLVYFSLLKKKRAGVTHEYKKS